MKPVERKEILDYVTYEEGRDAFREKMFAVKAPRRVHIGEYLTLLFENHETMLYQIQEMIRTERMVKEADIQHEIDTYNEVLGGDGEFGCTLLIEIDDPAVRDVNSKSGGGCQRRCTCSSKTARESGLLLMSASAETTGSVRFNI